jgi:hypothetical protein
MTSQRSISLPRLFAAATTLVLAWLVTPAVAQNAYITNNGSSNAISASGACLMDVVPVTTGMDQLARHSSALGTGCDHHLLAEGRRSGRDCAGIAVKV